MEKSYIFERDKQKNTLLKNWNNQPKIFLLKINY